MKRAVVPILLLLSVVFAGCITPRKDVAALQVQTDKLQGQVTDLNKAIMDQNWQMKSDLDAIRRSLDDLKIRLDELGKQGPGSVTPGQLEQIAEKVREQQEEFAVQRTRDFMTDWANRRADELTDQLSLTDEQTKKIKEGYAKIQEDMAQAFQGMRDGGQAGRESMRDMFGKLRESGDALMEQVLTAEQLAKYREMQEERRQRFGDRGRGRGRRDGGRRDGGQRDRAAQEQQQ